MSDWISIKRKRIGEISEEIFELNIKIKKLKRKKDEEKNIIFRIIDMLEGYIEDEPENQEERGIVLPICESDATLCKVTHNSRIFEFLEKGCDVPSDEIKELDNFLKKNKLKITIEKIKVDLIGKKKGYKGREVQFKIDLGSTGYFDNFWFPDDFDNYVSDIYPINIPDLECDWGDWDSEYVTSSYEFDFIVVSRKM